MRTIQPISKISDYALIGDSRCAALVSNTGSIDWLCLPHFDSPSVFNRLIDAVRGGYFSIRPIENFSVRRHYINNTNLLVTEFQTESGCVRITEFMPALSEAEKRGMLIPFRSILRIVEGLNGSVEMELRCIPRPENGLQIPRFVRRSRKGYFADVGKALFHLATEVDLQVMEGGLTGQWTVRQREKNIFWLAYSLDAPAVYPQFGAYVDEIKTRSLSFWEQWASRCSYRGPYRDAVVRSALVLKLLTFAPSNAMVAAPTTSLPETLGGSRNWDYRYCWLRDASFAAQIFFRLGYIEEAAGFVHWLTHSTRLTQPALKVVYDVYGRLNIAQKEMEFLDGYCGSRPVHIGNKAVEQYQLDIYGEVMDALWLYMKNDLPVDRDMKKRLCTMADYVVDHWSYPDHGIWEIPGSRRHYLHSKVLCWVALDRACRIAQRLGIQSDRTRWEHVGRQIRESIFQEGFNQKLGHFTQILGGTALDASAYIFPLVGFIDSKDSRLKQTMEALEGICREELVYRYRIDDGLPGEEGTFLACAFWRVEALCVMGRYEQAAAYFELLDRRANDVGLYSEEIQAEDGLFLGNFPQALSHLSHIAAALRLSGHNL